MSSRLTPARVSPLAAAGVSDYILNLLSTLHAESLEQESKIDKKVYADPTGVHAATVDKFIALDADKAEYVYSLLRATGAINVVEAGTSFGVSTIYLALAVAANAKAKGVTGRVIATEHEKTKAERARGYWRNCGKMVEDVIELREGDLRQTLTKDLGTVDFLLLDSEFALLLLLCWQRYVTFRTSSYALFSVRHPFQTTIRKPGISTAVPLFSLLPLPSHPALSLCQHPHLHLPSISAPTGRRILPNCQYASKYPTSCDHPLPRLGYRFPNAPMTVTHSPFVKLIPSPQSGRPWLYRRSRSYNPICGPGRSSWRITRSRLLPVMLTCCLISEPRTAAL